MNLLLPVNALNRSCSNGIYKEDKKQQHILVRVMQCDTRQLAKYKCNLTLSNKGSFQHIAIITGLTHATGNERETESNY